RCRSLSFVVESCQTEAILARSRIQEPIPFVGRCLPILNSKRLENRVNSHPTRHSLSKMARLQEVVTKLYRGEDGPRDPGESRRRYSHRPPSRRCEGEGPAINAG